ncbi:MAG TPA: nucleotide exchange factor GrpE [Actinomycetota bacterium]
MAPHPDHDEQEQEPRIRITDRRRFADLDQVEPDAGPLEEGGLTVGEGSPAAAEGGEVASDLASARGEAEKYLEHLQRLQAEFDNYRKRVVKEQSELAQLGAMPVARRMLEVLDDFDLALMSADEATDYERIVKGVELVYAKLVDALKAEGLERIEALGEPFDPEFHEALLQTGEGEGEPIVADVLRPGYTLKGRVLRPAGVRVERR